MKYFLLIIICLVFTTQGTACQCPVSSLNAVELAKYDIICKGKISHIQLKQDKSDFIFEVQELYKGSITEKFRLLFNDLDPCKLNLREGDEWIIYTRYKQINNSQLDVCSRSRMFFKNAKEDYFAINSGISYDDELVYLRKQLGLHRCLKNDYDQEDVSKRNIIPSSTQFVVILLVSIAGLVFFYWLVQKFLK